MTIHTTNTTKLFLNTWGAYNNGCIGYGWMTPAEVLEFIEENPEKDGGEFFLADIDNYCNIEVDNLEYCNIEELCEAIELLENLDEYERNVANAISETHGVDIIEAVKKLEYYTVWEDREAYFDCCDELIEHELKNDNIISRYFDFEAYHRDCMFDVYEASNGFVVSAY